MNRPPVSMTLVRAALTKRSENTPVRELADEVGMPFGNLARFLRQPTSPQRRTRELLLRWYYRKGERVPEPPREDRETALAVLRTYLGDESKPKSVRERRLRELIQRLEEEVR